MHFSKAIVFSYPPGLDFTPLEAMLAELPFKPCEPSAMSSEGFVPPVYMDDAPFAYRTGELILIAVQTESRIVPPAVVDERRSKSKGARGQGGSQARWANAKALEGGGSCGADGSLLHCQEEGFRANRSGATFLCCQHQ